jgi:hypothetical protein
VGSRTIDTDAQFDAVVERQALKRRLTPDDTAAAVAFLASDGAAALTGQTLVIDWWSRPSVAPHHAVSGCRPRSGRHPDRGHYRRLPLRHIERGAGRVAAGPWADVQDKVLLVALPGVAAQAEEVRCGADVPKPAADPPQHGDRPLARVD